MDLEHALGEQEQAAEQQHHIPPREAPAGELQPGLHQTREPHDREQQDDARQHRQRESAKARPVLQPRRQPLYQDGEKDDVVDAEDDLEERERDERHPAPRIGDQREVRHRPTALFARYGS